jgi:16S rRNA (uracil1498-N3)-methyltransferase
MNLFFVDQELAPGVQVRFQASEFRHLVQVLRHKEGDCIAVTNGRNQASHVRLVSISKNSAEGIVEETFSRPPDRIRHLFLGMIKHRERLDWALEKSVELGATAITLVATDRSEKHKVNSGRIHNLLLAAMKQSLRWQLPHFFTAPSLEVALMGAESLNLVVAHEKTDVSQTFRPIPEAHYALFVGPEGGFSDREIALFEKNNASFVSLGANRLRAETAALTLLAKF